MYFWIVFYRGVKRNKYVPITKKWNKTKIYWKKSSYSRWRFLSSGINKYLSKPFDLRHAGFICIKWKCSGNANKCNNVGWRNIKDWPQNHPTTTHTRYDMDVRSSFWHENDPSRRSSLIENRFKRKSSHPYARLEAHYPLGKGSLSKQQ